MNFEGFIFIASSWNPHISVIFDLGYELWSLKDLLLWLLQEFHTCFIFDLGFELRWGFILLFSQNSTDAFFPVFNLGFEIRWIISIKKSTHVAMLFMSVAESKIGTI